MPNPTAAPDFIDLLPDLLKLAGKNKGASPHQIARDFVLNEGAIRGGVEVIAVLDKAGNFIGAGTQNLPGGVNFPPAIMPKLWDPKSNLVVHHNHPSNNALSCVDASAVGAYPGLGWMIAHQSNSYSAMRASDHIFKAESNPLTREQHLYRAHDAASAAAGFSIYAAGIDSNRIELIADELALRAMAKTGSIHYYSSFNTGLPHDAHKQIVQSIITTCIEDTRRGGSNPVWSGAYSPPGPSTSAGQPGYSGGYALPDPSSVHVGFNRFLDILSRQNAASHDAASPGRPEPTEIPEMRGGHPGLASAGPPARPVLESGLKSAAPAHARNLAAG